MLSVREVTKKPKSEGYYKGKMEKKNQKQMQTWHNVKSRNRQQDEQCWENAQCSQEKNFCNAPFSSIFLLFFPLVFDMQC